MFNLLRCDIKLEINASDQRFYVDFIRMDRYTLIEENYSR